MNVEHTYPLPAPTGSSKPRNRKPLWKRAGSALAALGLLLAKLATKLKALLLLAPKLKLLTTSGSMLVSMAAYSLMWGWRFAAGFVVLLLVHELGHVFQLRREGIPASAPMFIPFLGAAVAMKEMPKDAAAEARVGLAGPVLEGMPLETFQSFVSETLQRHRRIIVEVGVVLSLFLDDAVDPGWRFITGLAG